MDEEDVVHIYSGILPAIKRNEIGSFVETWLDLEGIMLSEISQSDKGKFCMISLICAI